MGEIEGFFTADSKFILMPGITGSTSKASSIVMYVELRFKSPVDKSVIMTQGYVVYNVDEKAFFVLWPEKVQRVSIQEDGTIKI